MRGWLFPHELFFWTSAFFLIGVLLGSATVGAPYTILWAAGAAVGLGLLLRLKEGRWRWLTLAAAAGAVYFHLFSYWQNQPPLIFGQRAHFSAIAVRSDPAADGQKVAVKTDLGQLIIVEIFRYPEFRYGDRLAVTGIIKPSRSPLANGVMVKPDIELVSAGGGWRLKRQLAAVRRRFQENLKEVLPYTQAVFLSGLTVGGRSELSPSWQEKFRQSGTMHLIALSGYNIVIIIHYLGAFFVRLCSRRKAFWMTAAAIVVFTIMAGAEASLVRAAIMGLIAVLAASSGRPLYFRNAVTAAALAMTIVQPAVLVFDLGFQLSFLALIGIAALGPRLTRFVRWQFPGKQGIITTVAAEAAVLPFLLMRFGSVSPWGVISNVFIIPFIPLTMGLGFAAGALGFVSPLFSLPAAAGAGILLSYELAVINLFAGAL